MINYQYNNKLVGIFLFFLLLYSIVIFNLYTVQIRQTGYFKNLANQQYNVTHTITPIRAEIFDRNGLPIAVNKDSIAAFIIPSKLEHDHEVKQFLARHFDSAYSRLMQNSNLHFLYIKRRLTETEIEILKNSSLTDIKFLKEPSRFYPIESLATVVGITDINNNGLMGLEYMYNNHLAGKSSTHLLEKDARSGHFFFKSETKIEGTTGKAITLTIDSILQFLVYEELKEYVAKVEAKEGAVLILDPESGEIFVMANYPDFNPNKTENLDLSLTKNQIIANAYELGSVIKAFLTLAALEEEVVTADELIDCENKKETTLNGFHFSTWKPHGLIPFSEVIVGSNNIGVAKVAQRLNTKLYDHYLRLGFGQKIEILPGENRGFINPPKFWSNASSITLSFGYEMSANLLQLAQAMGIIVNDGYMVKPQIIKSDNIIKKSEILYKEKTIKTIKEILKKIIPTNLAKKSAQFGYEVYGKTGTARLLTNGRYEENKNIFTFMGAVEKGDYKRIIITFIKEIKQKNVYASSIALPLFEQVLDKMLMHDKII